MSDQLQSAVYQVLTELEMPDQISIREATAFISNYVSEAEYTIPLTSDKEIPEKARLKEDEEGHLVGATIVKFSNLKFKLIDLLLEMVRTVPTVAAALALTNPVRKALALLSVSLQFIEKVKPLLSVNVGAHEAQLLLIIYILIREKEIPTVDRLTVVVNNKMSESQIMGSLDVLEKLKCIERAMDKIILNDSIEIEHAA